MIIADSEPEASEETAEQATIGLASEGVGWGEDSDDDVANATASADPLPGEFIYDEDPLKIGTPFTRSPVSCLHSNPFTRCNLFVIVGSGDMKTFTLQQESPSSTVPLIRSYCMTIH